MNPFNKNNKLVNSNNSVRPNIKLNLADIFQDALNNSKKENTNVNIIENQITDSNRNNTNLGKLDNKYANSICYGNNNIHFSSTNKSAQENISDVERPRIKIASKCLKKLYNNSSFIINEAPLNDEVGKISPIIKLNKDASKINNIVIVTPKKHSFINNEENLNELKSNITNDVNKNDFNSKTNNNIEDNELITISKKDNSNIEVDEETVRKINTRKKSNKKKQKKKNKSEDKSTYEIIDSDVDTKEKLRLGITYNFSNIEKVLNFIEVNNYEYANCNEDKSSNVENHYFKYFKSEEEIEQDKLSLIPSFHKWFKIFYSKHLSRKTSNASDNSNNKDNFIHWTADDFYKYYFSYSLPNLNNTKGENSNYGPLICRVYETTQIDYYYLLRVHDLFGNYACLVVDDSTDNVGLFNGIKAMLPGDLLIVKAASYLYTQSVRMSFNEVYLSVDGNKENYIIIN